MGKLRIEINLDKPAFIYNPNAVCSHILEGFCRYLAICGKPLDYTELFDVNGNDVGFAEFVDDEDL